jgi:hypothetical protein
MLNTLSMNSALNSGLKTKILVLFVTKKSRKRTSMHNKELVDSEFFFNYQLIFYIKIVN